MPIGGYRFRRSFGNVASRFRGARPDTYPLLSYVKDGLALAYEALSSLIISDKSGNGYDATLYTGRYFSTDGSADKGIVADCSAAGSGSYYLTGKIKPSGTTAKATMNGSTASNLTGLSAGVWQDFTTASASLTPSQVVVGWDGTAFNATSDDWSDVRLIDASDDSVVGRWQGSDSSAADLDGYPALDSSGNGYHGTHVGCAGGTGEATILQAAGQDWSKAYLYDGTANEYIELDGDLTFSGDFRIRIQFYTTSNSAYQGLAGYEPFASGEGYISVRDDRLRLNDGATVHNFNTAVPNQELQTCEFRRSSGTLSTYLNDVLIGSVATATTFSLNMIGGLASSTNNFNGAILKILVNTSADSDTWTNEWNGEGKAITGLNDGTLVGTPAALLIPESNTAGEDALGNPIDNPRVNNEVINLFGDGEYAQIPAIGDVRSITLAIYNDGTTKDIVVDSLSAGFISIASNVVSSADAGTFYVNGAATTTLSAGWNIVGITYTADTSSLNSATIEATSGSLLAYEPSKSLTADEQLQNYNAFKSKYGL